MTTYLSPPRHSYKFLEEYYSLNTTAKYLNNIFQYSLFSEEYLKLLFKKKGYKYINNNDFVHKKYIAGIIYNSSLSSKPLIKTIDEYVYITSLTNQALKKHEALLPIKLNLSGSLALTGNNLWIYESIFGLSNITLCYAETHKNVGEQLELLFPDIKSTPIVWREDCAHNNRILTKLDARNTFLKHIIEQGKINIDNNGYSKLIKDKVWVKLQKEYQIFVESYNDKGSNPSTLYPQNMLEYLLLKPANIFNSGKNDFFNSSKNPAIKNIITFKHGRQN